MLESNHPPPFETDKEFDHLIVLNIPPNHHFPYIRLQNLDYIKDISISQLPTTHLQPAHNPTKSTGVNSTIKDTPHSTSSCKKPKRMPYSDQNKNSECPICTRKFFNQHVLGFHIKARHRRVSKPFICPVCPSSFKANHELKHHLVTQHPDEFTSYKNAKKTKNTSKNQSTTLLVMRLHLQCPHCPKKFSHKSRLTRHIKTHSDEIPWMCKTCGSGYKTLGGLQVHQAKQSCQPRLKSKALKCLKCLLCNKALTDTKHLSRHLRLTHGVYQNVIKTNKPYSCGVCGNKFQNRSNLDIHKSKNICESILARCLECKKCGIFVNSKESLRKHSLICLGPEILNQCQGPSASHSCVLCTFGGNSSESQNLHIAEEALLASTTCKGCGGSVTNKKNLRRHYTGCRKAIELGLQSVHGHLKCSQCTQTFYRRPHLESHEKTHGDKFPCLECPTGFISASTLTRHKLIIHPILADSEPADLNLSFQIQSGATAVKEAEITLPTLKKLPITFIIPCKPQYQQIYSEAGVLTGSINPEPQNFVTRRNPDASHCQKGDPDMYSFSHCPVGVSSNVMTMMDPLSDFHPQNDLQLNQDPLFGTGEVAEVEDRILSWVRSTTNTNPVALLTVTDCSVPDVIPTTILKMEQ